MAVVTAAIAVLALAGNLGPVGVTAARLRTAIAGDFNNLTLLQQQLIGRTVPAGAGCYKAQSPPSFVGQQPMCDARGHEVVNPLFVVYGCFNPLG